LLVEEGERAALNFQRKDFEIVQQDQVRDPSPTNRAVSIRCRMFSVMSELGVRRGKAALSSGCKSHPANAPAGSNRSSHGGNEVAEAFFQNALLEHPRCGNLLVGRGEQSTTSGFVYIHIHVKFAQREPRYARLRERAKFFDSQREWRGLFNVLAPDKITIGQMRQSGVTGVLIYCADHKCSHVVTASVEEWPDDVRLSDVEGRYVVRSADTAALISGRIGNPENE
jgi:hypothetical protein